MTITRMTHDSLEVLALSLFLLYQPLSFPARRKLALLCDPKHQAQSNKRPFGLISEIVQLY